MTKRSYIEASCKIGFLGKYTGFKSYALVKMETSVFIVNIGII